eukprot:492545_1
MRYKDSHESDLIFKYNVMTEQWEDTSNLLGPPVPLSYGCLTTNQTHAFLVDGKSDSLDRNPRVLQIYNIADNQWTSHTTPYDDNDGYIWEYQYCHIVNNELFVFGGRFEYTGQRDAWDEQLWDIHKYNLHLNQWSKLPVSLPGSPYGGKTVFYNDVLYLVGDFTRNITRAFNTNTQTFDETMTLPTSVEQAGVILVDNIIYAFGGRLGSSAPALSVIQYCTLPTKEPTAAPSVNPSEFPSTSPSINPSTFPSVSPSTDPSAFPSLLPSINPSYNPSESSVNPTVFPSTSPSDGPSATPISQSTSSSLTFHPSHNPSRNPSHNPSDKPTAFPSHNPSKRPIIFSSAKPSINPSERPTQNPHKEEGRITTTNIINSDHMEPKQMDTVMIYAVSGSVLMVLLLASIVLIVFILKYKRDINKRLVHSATTTGETEGQKTTKATAGTDVGPQADGTTYGQQTMNTTVGRNRIYTVDSIGPQTMNSTVGRNRIYTTDIIGPQTMNTTDGVGMDAERPLPVEAIQDNHDHIEHARYKPQRCVECGVMIKQEMIQMYGTGVSVCATCKSLECDDVDDAVDQMFDPQYSAKHRKVTAGGDHMQTAGGGYRKRTAGGDPQIHELDESDDNDSATLDEVEGDGKDDEKPYDYTQGIKQTNRGGVMETAGNYEKEEQKDDVLLNSVEMQNVDPNKMHQMNLNNCVSRYR